MSVNLIINGITYPYPQTGEEDWGDNATNWAVAVTSGMLQKSGGLFTLTAEVDFGSQFGIASLYYKSRSANLATAGNIRLANTDSINFRDAGNTADLNLRPDPSNDSSLLYGSTNIVTGAAPTISTDLTIDDSSESMVLEKLQSVALPDAATTTVFSTPATTAKNFIVMYSITRGSTKETGKAIITSDGTSAELAIHGSSLGSVGTTLSADVDSGNVRLRATTTSTGSAANIKYTLFRWND